MGASRTWGEWYGFVVKGSEVKWRIVTRGPGGGIAHRELGIEAL